MKRLFCVLLMFLFAFSFVGCKGCVDGLCDECNSKKNVEVYTTRDGKEIELCLSCYLEKAASGILGGLLG